MDNSRLWQPGPWGERDGARRVLRARARLRRAAAVTSALGVILVGAPGPAAAPASGFLVPVAGPAVPVTGFDPPAQPWLAGHRGVDLAADPLAAVRAPAPATVLFAGSVGGKPVVSLDHGGGLRTTYEPVSALVSAGDVVTAGQMVGHVVAGHPGCPVVACLHWGARVDSGGDGGDDDEYIDPMTLLDPAQRQIRLKPTRPGDGEG